MPIAVFVELLFTVAVVYPVTAPQRISRALCLQQELVNLSADHHTPPQPWLSSLGLSLLIVGCNSNCFFLPTSPQHPPGLFAAPQLKISRKSEIDAKGWQRMLQLGAGPSMPAANTAGEELWAS